MLHYIEEEKNQTVLNKRNHPVFFEFDNKFDLRPS